MLSGTAISNANTDSVCFELRKAESSLINLFGSLNCPSVSNKESVNDSVVNLFKSILTRSDSFYYTFDSLTAVGIVSSDDDLLRIFSWNYQLPSFRNKYSCIIQYRRGVDKEPELFFLRHTDTTRDKLKSGVFNPDNWYGALYYQIQTSRFYGDTVYTLFGFDLNDYHTNIKIVDVLSFSNGEPSLGLPRFRLNGDISLRVVFEYSSKVVMFLRFVDERQMIIYDHLSPVDPRFTGQYRFYGPDLSFDGFALDDNGYWVHLSDIEPKQISH